MRDYKAEYQRRIQNGLDRWYSRSQARGHPGKGERGIREDNMASVCTNSKCPYGWKHHAEHVRAARLGWRRLKSGYKPALSFAFRGYTVEKHRGGKVILRDSNGEHLHLDEKEANIIVREVKTSQKQEEIKQRKEAKYREREEAAYAKQRNAEEKEMLYHALREVVGKKGIRNYSKVGGRQILQEDVWNVIPRSYRASRNNTAGLTPDEVADELRERFPYLGINSDSELAQAFRKVALQRSNSR